MAKQTIDWITLKRLYFSNPEISTQDVADQFGLSYYSVRNKAQKENWHRKRSEQFVQIEEKVLEGQGEDIITIRIRQSKILKSLLAKSLSRLQNTDFSEIGEATLVKIVLDILKSERELYPKQLELSQQPNTAQSLEDIPQEFIDAYIELCEKKIMGNSVPRIKD